MYNFQNKFYQMFILGLEGDNYNSLLANGLGGVIFFTKDILFSEQFAQLTKNIKQKSLITPFLSIDQEGGRVERTQNIHNGKKYLSAKFAAEKGLDFLKNQTLEISKELLSYGINLNFAPCIDVNTNPNNPIIGERAFSSNPEKVIECGKIVTEIYKNNGIIPCIKHFPGHGDANADSHLTLPKIDLSMEEMKKYHIKPFKELINLGVDMIMVAHLNCFCFGESNIPSSLNKNVINYLKEDLAYKGVIISDDMEMKGVADYGISQAIEMGIRAGLNLFIYRNSTSEITNAIDEVYKKALNDSELQHNIEQSFDKIIDLKKKYKLI